MSPSPSGGFRPDGHHCEYYLPPTVFVSCYIEQQQDMFDESNVMMSSGLFAPGWSFQVAVTSVSETIIDANRFGAVFGSQLSVGEIHAEQAEIVDKDVSLVMGCPSSCPLESEVLKTWEVTNGSTLLNESSSSVIWVSTRGNAAKFTSVGNIAIDEDEGEGLSRQKFGELRSLPLPNVKEYYPMNRPGFLILPRPHSWRPAL
jgi:hypothetical protein